MHAQQRAQLLRRVWHVQVVRCFEDDDIVHVSGKVDPKEDTAIINFELALADVTQIEKRIDRLGKGAALVAASSLLPSRVKLPSVYAMHSRCAGSDATCLGDGPATSSVEGKRFPGKPTALTRICSDLIAISSGFGPNDAPQLVT